jgi:Adenine-specific methyltransferase EcoRI
MNVANTNLGDAKRAKNDEFYTQYHDIEKEMNAYLELNPDVFKNKSVFLPCDDPEWSNFTKYFAQNFAKLGLSKLVSTSYALDNKPDVLNLQPSLFETESPQYDSSKTRSKGKIFTLVRDLNADKKIDFEDLEWAYLEGDGDFRSLEISSLRDEADIVITNPPFSLFREFLSWLMSSNKLFSIIGSMNAITLKEVFPLIRDSRMWLGNGFTAGNAYFESPVGREYASGVFDEKTGLVKFRNVIWYTNIDHGKRHKPLSLMTMADNVKFSNHKEIRGIGYRKYENYDAIDVPFTDAIPSDYKGMMGVPISFLDKFSPDQFEILGITQRNDDPYKIKKFTTSEYKNANDLNARAVVMVDGQPKSVYARILIRHKGEELE